MCTDLFFLMNLFYSKAFLYLKGLFDLGIFGSRITTHFITFIFVFFYIGKTICYALAVFWCVLLMYDWSMSFDKVWCELTVNVGPGKCVA